MKRPPTSVRVAFEEHSLAIVVGLVVLALAGGYLTYATHVDPGTQIVTQTDSTWESTGEFDHEATVREGTDAFSEGQVLEGRDSYFRGVTPVLDGAFTYAYNASDDGDVDVTTTLALVQRSVSAEDDGDNETEYWRVERDVAEERVESLEPGDSIDVPFSANVTEAARQATETDDQLGGTPGDVEVALIADVEYTGSINGEEVDRAQTYRLPVEIDGGVYRVDDPGPWTDADERTSQVAVPAEYGPVRAIGAPILFGTSLAALAGLIVARRRGLLEVTRSERDRLSCRRVRREYDEWITCGRVPPEALSPEVVTVDSLDGLVDVAIDANRRVIEDAASGRFVVIGPDVTYRYLPPGGTRRADPRTHVRDRAQATERTIEDDVQGNREQAAIEPTASNVETE